MSLGAAPAPGVLEERYARLPAHQREKLNRIADTRRRLDAAARGAYEALREAQDDLRRARAALREAEEHTTRRTGGTLSLRQPDGRVMEFPARPWPPPELAQRVQRLEADVARLHAEHAAASAPAGVTTRLYERLLEHLGLRDLA
ncbi:MAG: hypothetical protein E6G67_12980 [Actinobacteria bacterium]|nr:MAG: hypothetical protein E6G67_12980 [Actinomycetota bacterium]